ncbi:MAG: DUF1801 domain-containing protein [Ferruginibacter sp.]
MAKAQNKTIETVQPVADFLHTIKDENKRKDCFDIIALLEKHTKLPAKMWGNAIIGFGTYHYTYESGREGDAPLVAFSPRANSIVLYLAAAKENENMLKQLGKHKLSGGCIHIKKLEDINTGIMLKMANDAIKYYKTKYPEQF